MITKYLKPWIMTLHKHLYPWMMIMIFETRDDD